MTGTTNGLGELEKDWLSLPLWIRDLMQSTWTGTND